MLNSNSLASFAGLQLLLDSHKDFVDHKGIAKFFTCPACSCGYTMYLQEPCWLCGDAKIPADSPDGLAPLIINWWAAYSSASLVRTISVPIWLHCELCVQLSRNIDFPFNARKSSSQVKFGPFTKPMCYRESYPGLN